MPNSDFKVASAPLPTSAAARPAEEILNLKEISRGFKKTQGELLVLDGVTSRCVKGKLSECSGAQARASPRCCESSRV